MKSEESNKGNKSRRGVKRLIIVLAVLLVVVLWPLGLTGLWMNFAGTSLLAGVLAAVVLRRFLKRMPRQDLEAAG